jgi:hypothetical protein
MKFKGCYPERHCAAAASGRGAMAAIVLKAAVANIFILHRTNELTARSGPEQVQHRWFWLWQR